MKKLLILASILGLFALSAEAKDSQQTMVTLTGTASVSLTGTTNAVVAAPTLTGTSQTFVLASARVIVTSATAVTASPVVALYSGTTALTTSGTVSTVNTSVELAKLVPEPVVATSATGSPLTLLIVTGGTATNLAAKISVTGFYLK